MSQQTLKEIQNYYGQVLKTKEDLKTSACCPLDAPPPRVQALLKNVHDIVQSKFYGCGSPLPVAADGCTVLDLGCGTGRDAFILSQIVGKTGRVIGIDMTDEQLSVAKQYVGWHMDRFGYEKPNVGFVKGYIEDLKSAGIQDSSVDIVISNCVINLSPDKKSVFEEIHRVLKPGGELYFSDVFAGRRVPAELQNDTVLRGECLGGAMYTEDFRRMLRDIGILDYRTVSKRQLTLDDPDVQRKAGMVDFYSVTIRAFKVDLEDICENYGHVAWYKGTIPECPHGFVLDDHHEFKTGQPMPVCGNTANMLAQTRYAGHFRVEGDFSTHYGVFDCASKPGAVIETGACC
ncbi:MAG: methyltransferase domain-containing protein [Thiobacillus sp.]|nr:methyltransferase domain-containing protein [Thiobacillus sp.]